jgi:hypothetical protein
MNKRQKRWKRQKDNSSTYGTSENIRGGYDIRLPTGGNVNE